jgi:phosphoribosyl 1,2-cyclic phosphate phosphodiesterase
MKVTILGCGSSQGNPRVGLGWGACDPSNPKNRRMRCSILVETGDTKVLVDAGPDCREQLIYAEITRLNGVILTHEHADHIHGIDDLRPLALMHRKRVDVHTDKETAEVLNLRFGYCFTKLEGSFYPPILKLHTHPDFHEYHIDALEVLPLPVNHGQIKALAHRFGDLAYIPDVKDIPPESEAQLQGLEVLILDALRYDEHNSHFNLDEALAWIARLKPQRAVLTNLHCDLDYDVLSKLLPAHIVPAYDGMVITLR